MAKPLYQTSRETPAGPLTHPATAHHNFSLLQDALLMSPALDLPDPTQPYHLYTDEKVGVATVVLAQLSGPLN